MNTDNPMPVDLPGYLALPPGGSGPGVLVLHAWWGLNDFFRRFCDRLAAEGFVVAAPDLYNGVVVDTIPAAEEMIQKEDYRQYLAQSRSALDWLKAHPAVSAPGLGVIGFSMGAAYALALSTAAPEDIRAVVTFYGSYPIDFSAARAAYQCHFCSVDPWEPLEGVRETEQAMQTAGREHTFHFYEHAGHWFMEDNRPDAYEPEAARLAWGRTLEFLRQHLDGG